MPRIQQEKKAREDARKEAAGGKRDSSEGAAREAESDYEEVGRMAPGGGARYHVVSDEVVPLYIPSALLNSAEREDRGAEEEEEEGQAAQEEEEAEEGPIVEEDDEPLNPSAISRMRHRALQQPLVGGMYRQPKSCRLSRGCLRLTY